MNIVIIPIFAFVVSTALHLAALKLFPRWRLLDFPERYGHTRAPIPYPTGIIAIVLFLCFFSQMTSVVTNALSPKQLGIMGAIVLLGIFSFIDDRTPLPSLLRLLVQVLCGLIIFATGTRIYSLTNPFASFTGFEVISLDTHVIEWALLSNPSIVGAIFTVIWLGLTINALNWFDGIPGQVSTLSAIGFLAIGFLALSERVSQPELALLSFLLAALALGGLVFDFPPNRVLMGDTGAMFFGLMLGVLTIYAGGKVATAFLVLGVPLIDFGIVIGRRVLKGKSILKGDTTNEHLHHRLLQKGWSPRAVITLTAGLGSAFGITALFLTTNGKMIAGGVLLLVMMGLSWYSKS